jgi:two-component system phosphate regulon response regulator PhoB
VIRGFELATVNGRAEPLVVGTSALEERPLWSAGTVVVAEDDVATRMLLCRVLTRAAFTVHAVENGELACQTVRLRRPDVILLDWMMPVMDGHRATRLIKADAQTRAIPIVMLTTHSRAEDRRAALEAGVEKFLTKPFEPDELVACVLELIGCRAAVAAAARELR